MALEPATRNLTGVLSVDGLLGLDRDGQPDDGWSLHLRDVETGIYHSYAFDRADWSARVYPGTYDLYFSATSTDFDGNLSSSWTLVEACVDVAL